jgi:major membrane immunogen (membrane-anchored lipoprotein)
VSARRPRLYRCAVIPALVAVALIGGCAPGEPDPAALRDEDGAALYADGTYVATYDYTSPEGWLPYLVVEIKAGLVRSVCFDAVASTGARMRSDERYVESQHLSTGVDIPVVIDTMRECLLENQTTPVLPCVPESEWVVYFSQLATAAMNTAAETVSSDRVTNRSTRIEVPPVSMPGPYLVTDSPDETGWVGELVVTYLDGSISAANYREAREDSAGTVTVKAEDQEYLDRYERTIGVDHVAVVESLVGQLLSGTRSDDLDAIAGATLTTTRFAALADRLEQLRTTPELPRRLCSD